MVHRRRKKALLTNSKIKSNKKIKRFLLNQGRVHYIMNILKIISNGINTVQDAGIKKLLS